MSFCLYPTEPKQRKSTDKTIDLETFIKMTEYLNRHLIDAMESLDREGQDRLTLAISSLNESITGYNEA